MKNWAVFYLLLFGTLSCKPTKGELAINASYTSIQLETEDPKLNKLIAPYKATVDSEMNKVIGYSEIAMPKIKDQPETVLGNFVADLVFEFAKTIDAQTDLCVLNNGGLRSSLPQGNITVRNVFELMPFDNEIVIVTLDGKNVKELFTYIAERKGVPVSGIVMKLEKMNGNVVLNQVKIGLNDFSENNTYKIATSDYLSGGGDNMTFLGKGSIQTTSKKIRDAIIDYIRLKTAENKKLKPVLDNRISYIN
jgi:2',3'-cyclic-nucleotide 2'-phosphodiesterase (5'-nucleotidase family)